MRYGSEPAPRPGFRLGLPARARPGGAQRRHPCRSLLREPGRERGPKGRGHRVPGVDPGCRRAAGVEDVQPDEVLGLELLPCCEAEIRGPSDQRLERVEDLREPKAGLDARQAALVQADGAVTGRDGVVVDAHRTIMTPPAGPGRCPARPPNREATFPPTSAATVSTAPPSSARLA